MPPEFLAIEARGLAGAADGDVVLGDPSDRRLGPDDAGVLDGDGPDPNWNVGWVKPQGPALVGRRPPELHLDARRVTTDRDGSYPRAEPVDEGVKPWRVRSRTRWVDRNGSRSSLQATPTGGSANLRDHIDLSKAVLSLSEARLLFGVDEAKLSLGAG
jgi:hypothetical protein